MLGLITGLILDTCQGATQLMQERLWAMVFDYKLVLPIADIHTGAGKDVDGGKREQIKC